MASELPSHRAILTSSSTEKAKNYIQSREIPQSFEALMATKKLEQQTFETTLEKQEHDSVAPSYKSGGIVSKMQKDLVKKHSKFIGFQMGLYVEKFALEEKCTVPQNQH